MARKKRPAQRHEIFLEHNGKKYQAHYYVENNVVTVQSAYGSTSTQVGGSTAEVVARILLREILDGAKSRGEV